LGAGDRDHGGIFDKDGNIIIMTETDHLLAASADMTEPSPG
jgi:hypothetical protein